MGQNSISQIINFNSLKAINFSEELKKELIKIFIDKIYSKFLKKHYETNKIVYNYIDETWPIDLADMIDYNFSNNKGFR